MVLYVADSLTQNMQRTYEYPPSGKSHFVRQYRGLIWSICAQMVNRGPIYLFVFLPEINMKITHMYTVE